MRVPGGGWASLGAFFGVPRPWGGGPFVLGGGPRGPLGVFSSRPISPLGPRVGGLWTSSGGGQRRGWVGVARRRPPGVGWPGLGRWPILGPRCPRVGVLWWGILAFPRGPGVGELGGSSRPRPFLGGPIFRPFCGGVGGWPGLGGAHGGCGGGWGGGPW
eukprot:UN2876